MEIKRQAFADKDSCYCGEAMIGNVEGSHFSASL
jgi:hypothetical protein